MKSTILEAIALLIGLKENVLAVRTLLNNHTGEGGFIPFKDLLDMADEYNLWKMRNLRRMIIPPLVNMCA
ncbi:hypothetical protein [Paenibacillus sp.]|uniref:hypothetical protein n=1 Tax=Paenibacillus sp. TaxID=58172 RepID=UPI0028ACC0CE|nr:hypothetical protein [Paenibacillus sp.]